MAAKQIVATSPVDGSLAVHIQRVKWLEDGNTWPKDQPREQVAMAVLVGEPFYTVGPTGAHAPVEAFVVEGKHYLRTKGELEAADNLLALPKY